MVEVIELQLISCRVEYTLNSNVNIPEYVGKENKEIIVDGSSNPDNDPVGQWTMTYGGYEFEINDLQIQDYYKTGNKIRPTIKDPKVTEEYQFASIVGSKADVEFKVELPTDLTGATVNVNVTSQATGTVNGSYDSTTGMYTGTITTDGTTNTNGIYTYEVKATKDGKEYIVKTTTKISKFLDDPQLEVPQDDKKMSELKIKVTNGYPSDANISYKYYISETETYGTESFTTDTEITKTGLTQGTQYNIKVEAYLNDQTTMVEKVIQEKTLEKTTEIRYIEDLEAISEDLTCNYKLMNDLDFKERSSYKTDEKYNYYNVDTDSNGTPDNRWEPLADATNEKFSGTFDGNYHSIKNLTTAKIAGYSFIYHAQNATFCRLKVDSFICDGDRYKGGYYSGGFVAWAESCNFYEVGINGSITGGYESDAGILVAHGTSCTVDKCFVDGNMVYRYHNGSPAPNSKAGGLGVFEGDSKITNSYTKGTNFTHGLANIQGNVEKCYSIASSTHPLVPLNVSVVSSFWNKENSGNISNNYEGEKTKAEMQTQSTYTNAGWDFNTIWEMDSNTGYPRLQWEKNIK